MRKRGHKVRVLAFEPNKEHVNQLERARAVCGYSRDEVTVVQKVVGSSSGHNKVTLDSFIGYRNSSAKVLLKIDVEGAELDVLSGKHNWLSRDTLPIIEVHKFEYLDEIRRCVGSFVGKLDRVDQRPLPFIGPEIRDPENWWLVSRLTKRE